MYSFLCPFLLRLYLQVMLSIFNIYPLSLKYFGVFSILFPPISLCIWNWIRELSSTSLIWFLFWREGTVANLSLKSYIEFFILVFYIFRSEISTYIPFIYSFSLLKFCIFSINFICFTVTIKGSNWYSNIWIPCGFLLSISVIICSFFCHFSFNSLLSPLLVSTEKLGYL